MPRRVEVDGVGEDESSVGVEEAGRDQVWDLCGRFVGNPLIDLETGGLGGVDVVDVSEPRAVVLSERSQERFVESEPGLTPESVDNRQGDLDVFPVVIEGVWP